MPCGGFKSFSTISMQTPWHVRSVTYRREKDDDSSNSKKWGTPFQFSRTNGISLFKKSLSLRLLYEVWRQTSILAPRMANLAKSELVYQQCYLCPLSYCIYWHRFKKARFFCFPNGCLYNIEATLVACLLTFHLSILLTYQTHFSICDS